LGERKKSTSKSGIVGCGGLDKAIFVSPRVNEIPCPPLGGMGISVVKNEIHLFFFFFFEFVLTI